MSTDPATSGGRMTPAGRAAFALHALVLIVATRQAAAQLATGSLGLAAILLVAAVTCLVGMLREASRPAPSDTARGEAAGPGWWRRRQTARRARAIIRAEQCTCDTAWWPSPTRPHAPWCKAVKNGTRP